MVGYMKRLFILIMCLSFFIVGCKKEESEVGDINYKKNVDVMTNEISYEIDGYHLMIKSNYSGMSYNDSLFSYMINDENGMFIVEYKELNNLDINKDSYNIYRINDKEYLYEYDNDYLDIYYFIDDNNYLSIIVENLNNEYNEENLLFLFNQLDFEIYK
jgi:hypothetical protein